MKFKGSTLFNVEGRYYIGPTVNIFYLQDSIPKNANPIIMNLGIDNQIKYDRYKLSMDITYTLFATNMENYYEKTIPEFSISPNFSIYVGEFTTLNFGISFYYFKYFRYINKLLPSFFKNPIPNHKWLTFINFGLYFEF